MVYQRFCRIAAIVFLLFTAYPLFFKVIEHRLAHDWAHSVLHLISAVAAVVASTKPSLAKLFTWGIGVVYGVLGIGGWFVDGLLLDTAFAIPLGPVENIFHLGLGSAALAVAAISRSSRPQPQAAP